MKALLLAAGCALLPFVGAAQSPRLVSLRQELRIGNLDGDAAALTATDQIAIAPNGNVYVLQPQDHQIKVFDRRGQHRLTFGRRGRGPGDFAGMRSFGIREDTVWVLDRVNHRLSLFNLEGKLLNTVAIPPVPVERSGTVLSNYHAVGLLVDRTILKYPVPVSRAVTDSLVQTAQLLRTDVRGKQIGNLAQMDVRGRSETLSRGTLKMVLTPPVTTSTLWSLSPDGRRIVVVDRPALEGRLASYTVKVISHNGSPIAQHKIPYTPREVPRAFTDSVREAWATKFVKSRFVANPADARKFAADSIFIPRMQPPINYVLIDDDYRVWLRETNLTKPTARWLILSPDGTRAALELASDVRIVAARGAEVWFVETDEFDVPYLVRSRLISK